MQNNTSHALSAGIHGASATPEDNAKTTTENPVVSGQKDSQLLDSQVLDELLRMVGEIVRESDRFTLLRAEVKAGIQSNTMLRKLMPRIISKKSIIPSYDGMLEMTTRRKMLSLCYQVLFGRQEDGGQSSAAEMAQAVILRLQNVKAKLPEEEHPRMKKGAEEILVLQREQLRLRIDRSISDVEAQLREFCQQMDEITIRSNKALREPAVRRFLVAIEGAKSEAEDVRADFEAAPGTIDCMIRIAEIHANNALPPLVMPSCGYLEPKYFADRWNITPHSVRNHLRNITKQPRCDWMTKENLKFGGRWEIHDKEVAEKFDEYLKKNTEEKSWKPK